MYAPDDTRFDCVEGNTKQNTQLTAKPVALIRILAVNFSHLHFNAVQRWMRVDFRQKRQNSPKLHYKYADIYRSFVYNSSRVIMKAIWLPIAYFYFILLIFRQNLYRRWWRLPA